MSQGIKITEEKKKLIIESLRQYGTIVAAAKIVGISDTAIHNEMNRSPSFKDAINKARDEGRGHVGESALQVVMSMAFDKDVENRNRLTAALALGNAFIPGFRGTTNIQGKIEHDVRVLTAIPRPAYSVTIDSPIVKQLPSPEQRLQAERVYMRDYMRKKRAAIKAAKIKPS